MQEALSGNYVNFGVFELYNDKALENALDVALSLALSVVSSGTQRAFSVAGGASKGSPRRK